MMVGLFTVAFAQRLAPGDRIRLICEQEPTLSVERVLAPDGVVDLPLLGRVLLGGRDIPEAEQLLEDLAARKLRSDHVLIAIELVRNLTGPVEFAGAVTRNGTAPFRSGMTLADIIKLAKPVAAAMNAVEITASDGKRVVVDAEATGSATRLKPGDLVFFPRAWGPSDVLVLGGVARPGSKEFVPGMTLRDLIRIGGGITAHGRGSEVRLERKGEAPRTIDVNSIEGTVGLQRGDTVTVPVVDNPRYVSVAGWVAKPGLIDFREGMTLTAAIRAAGGLIAFADPSRVAVKRFGEYKHRYDLSRIEAGLDPDLVLQPGDGIEVVAGRPKPPPPPKGKSRSGRVVPP